MSSNQRSTLESNPPKHQLTHHPNSDQGNRRNDQKKKSSKWRAECIVAEIQSILQTFCDYMHALGSLRWMFFVEFIDSVFVIVFFEKG